MRSVPGTDGKFDPARVCHACRNKGHWKGECPISKTGQKSNISNVYAKSVVLVAPAPIIPGPVVTSPHKTFVPCKVDESYDPFITEGYVSLADNVRKPVRILRDTGASQSFILASTLPFAAHTGVGKETPIVGIGLIPLWVSLHRFNLFSDLVHGEVVMGVRTSLPMEGVDIILGNDLAGGKVWKEVPPPLDVTVSPQCSEEADECARKHPKVFAACVVTRSRSKANLESGEGSAQSVSAQPSSSQMEGNSDVVKDQAQLFPVLLPSVSREELVREQACDPTLKPLLEMVCPESDPEGVPCGSFLQEGVLLRKWAQVVDNVQVDHVIQIVVPSNFRHLVDHFT